MCTSKGTAGWSQVSSTCSPPPSSTLCTTVTPLICLLSTHSFLPLPSSFSSPLLCVRGLQSAVWLLFSSPCSFKESKQGPSEVLNIFIKLLLWELPPSAPCVLLFSSVHPNYPHKLGPCRILFKGSRHAASASYLLCCKIKHNSLRSSPLR